jgi:hypothetical protein
VPVGPPVGVEVPEAYIFKSETLLNNFRERPGIGRKFNFRLYLKKFKKIAQVNSPLRYRRKPRVSIPSSKALN